MNPLFHALNIGTLAAWLSVAGFGTVGLIVPGWKLVTKRDQTEKLETLTITPDVIIGADIPAISLEEPAPSPQEIFPAPPALPDIPSTAPLPEIPDLPLAHTPAAAPAPRQPPQPTSARKSQSSSSDKPTSATTPGKGTSGSGMSKSNRLAAGHMPAPPYPSFARRNRQQGTVVVEFSVNPSGHVTAAFAKKSCQWPLLNQTAVRTVLGWSFPPGDSITLERSITFKLN